MKREKQRRDQGAPLIVTKLSEGRSRSRCFRFRRFFPFPSSLGHLLLPHHSRSPAAPHSPSPTSGRAETMRSRKGYRVATQPSVLNDAHELLC